MKITRENCEQFLVYVVAQMLRTDVTTVSTLLSTPALKTMLMQALSVWSTHIACTQHTVMEIAQQIGMTHEEVVSDFLHHIFGKGTKADKPYPRLTKLLSVACKDGPRAVAPYLMRVARNRALDLERRFEVRDDRSGVIMGFTQDDEIGVIDPGESQDDTTLAMEDDLIRRRALERFFAQMGQDFESDLVILADAVNIKRSIVAQLFFAGRQAELVSAVTQRLSSWLHQNVATCMQQLMAQAERYVLPARFREDYDALLSYLYRKSNGAARQRLAQRLKACGY